MPAEREGRPPFDVAEPGSPALRTPADRCGFRTDVRQGTKGEVALCRRIQQLTGVEYPELCRVGRDACEACCRHPAGGEAPDNPVVASLVYAVSETILARCGVAGCGVDQARQLQAWAQDRVEAYRPGADQPAAIPRQLETCCYQGERLGRLVAAAAAGPLGEVVFACRHPDHDRATARLCRRCRDWAATPYHGVPIRRRLATGGDARRAASPIRRWAVGLTTAPRREATLEVSLDSLARAGWETPHLFVDSPVELARRFRRLPVTLRAPRVGAWPNFYLALMELYFAEPHADAILMVQDDVLFYDREDLREYLQEALWPADPPGVVSLFCAAAETQPVAGWHRHEGPWTLGAQALIFPRPLAGRFLADPAVVAHRSTPLGGLAAIDATVGRWAQRSGVPVYFPTPSLVQHVGQTSTLWPSARAIGDRRADSFAGDMPDADAP